MCASVCGLVWREPVLYSVEYSVEIYFIQTCSDWLCSSGSVQFYVSICAALCATCVVCSVGKYISLLVLQHTLQSDGVGWVTVYYGCHLFLPKCNLGRVRIRVNWFILWTVIPTLSLKVRTLHKQYRRER